TVCVVGKMRDLILQLSKSSIYSTKPLSATNSRANEPIFGQEYASLRCKIFQWCDEYLEKICTKSNFTIEELNSYLDEMINLCYDNIQDLKKTYRIRINDRENIKGIILSLLDDCYLAYDEY
ncbi:hypothetical protein RAG83_16170, partial [Klebsiella quasipneumoniae subsp. similipneumoniae]